MAFTGGSGGGAGGVSTTQGIATRSVGTENVKIFNVNGVNNINSKHKINQLPTSTDFDYAEIVFGKGTLTTVGDVIGWNKASGTGYADNTNQPLSHKTVKTLGSRIEVSNFSATANTVVLEEFIEAVVTYYKYITE